MDPDKEAGSLSPGTVVGGYTIVSLLGHGGAGQVYEVEAPEHPKSLALKLLPKAHVEQHPGIVSAFHREFHRLEQLRHPRIIEVHQRGADVAGHYYTMELLEGRDF